jgi:hypothetical protein
MRWRRRGATVAAVAMQALVFGVYSVSAAPPPLTVGPNVNTSRLAGNQAESTIAVDPTNPKRIVVVSNNQASAFKDLFISRSTDGGATFTPSTIANGTDGGNPPYPQACADPSLAWDDFGNLFLTYLGRVGGCHPDDMTEPKRIEVLLSVDGGATFTNRGPLDSGDVDQPTVATGAGGVWVAYRDSSGSISARGAAVTGLATVGAFNAAQVAPGSAGGNFGDVAIGPKGQAMVTYEKPVGTAGPASLYINLDADGLGPNPFGAQMKATDTFVGGSYPIPAQTTPPDIDAEASIAYDTSGGPRTGNAYLVYTDAASQGSADTDVYFRSSTNDGAAWSSPIRVNDPNVKSQFLPKMAVDETTGVIGVVWEDARNSAGNNTAQLFGTVSLDGGVNFLGPDAQISTGTSDSSNSGSTTGFGDYLGLAFLRCTLYPSWSDNSNSTTDNPDGALKAFDIYTANATVSGCTPPAQIPEAGFTVLLPASAVTVSIGLFIIGRRRRSARNGVMPQ